MTLKEKRELSRKFTPKYYSKLNVPSITVMLCWLILGLAAVITVGLLLGEDMITYITMIVWVVVLLIILIVVLIISVKLKNRIITQRTTEIIDEFVDMPFEDATAALTERNVISEHGFVANIGEYAGKLVVPFGEAKITVHSANIYTKLFTIIQISNVKGAVIAEHIVDNALYNYILKKGVKIDFQANSKYLVSDKVTFVKKHFGADREKRAVWFWFGALGALVSDEMNNVNYSKKIVLRIVGKEYLK